MIVLIINNVGFDVGVVIVGHVIFDIFANDDVGVSNWAFEMKTV